MFLLYFSLGGNYVVLFLDKFSTAPALMLVVMMEAIAASWVRSNSRKKSFYKSKI
jgi:hypothetical protein